MNIKILLTGLFTLLLAVPAIAGEEKPGKSGFRSKQEFSGPGSTTRQLEEDDEVKNPSFVFESLDRALAPWFDWKAGLSERTGLQLGAAYTSVFQSTNDAPEGAEDSASSGIMRVFGRWGLHSNDSGNTGTLVFSFDHRHAYDELAPADFGFATGYLGIPGVLFNDAGTLLGDFNWQYSFNGGRSGLVVGRYDPNDFLDVLGYANPWTTFQNLSVLFNASIALPDWGTGIGLGTWFDDQWYGLGSISDANAVATEEKLFHETDELYSSAEFGWTPSRDMRFFQNLHVMVWHADERIEAGVEESQGWTVGTNWTFNERLMIFAKLGMSTGSAPIYNDSVTAGLIYYFPETTNLFGAAINWGEPPDSDDVQTSAEIFYRWQFSQNLAVTPAIQLIGDPALNPEEDQILYTSIRIRLSI